MDNYSGNKEYNIYRDIRNRTNGEIYLGIVGPVRTGKSTFIKRFMELMVLPFMEGEAEKERAMDELPQWNDALVLMKTHQMIELPGAVANLEDFTPIYIYSTVNVFCSAMDINELVRTYQDEVEELLTEEEKEN